MPANCFRCGDTIEDPVEENAQYITGASDLVEQESVERARAYVHTQSTKGALSNLQGHYPGYDMETLERAVASDADLIAYLGTPPHDGSGDNNPQERIDAARAAAPSLSDFDTTDVVDTSEAPAETVEIEQVFKDVDVQKTGLIHPRCGEDGDEIIW